MRVIVISFFVTLLSFAQTIKDIGGFVGVRSNQLIGYGIVVGLDGTGDKSEFAKQSLQNLLRNSDLPTPIMAKKTKNIAGVMVTADLPPFASQGDRLNIDVSSVGDAKSLAGGQLLLTALKGVNGQTYAVAQGRINIDKLYKTRGVIYSGAIVENELDYELYKQKKFTFTLKKSDATTASLVESVINDRFKNPIAFAKDTKNIDIQKPMNISAVNFISIVEGIPLDIDIVKKIVVDSSTSTVLVGGDIKILPATIATDNFTFRIKKYPNTPAQFDDLENKGQDIGEDVKIDLTNTMLNTKREPTVSDLVRAMKVMKLDMSEIINALQKLKSIGAIQAQIEIR